MSEELFFTTKIQKNCRKFYKRIYDFHVKVDMRLVDSLSIFGKLTLKEFSKIISTANDVFVIKGSDNLEISGAINDTSIMVVIPKKDSTKIEDFEHVLLKFLQQ